MTKIDFDALNRELEESAAGRQEAAPQPLSFDYFFSTTVFSQKLGRLLREARDFTNISYYFDLHAGGIKRFVKRVIRKCSHFLFFENFERQRNYNTTVLEAEKLLYRSVIGLQQQHERDMEIIRSLEARLNRLEAQHEQH